MNPKDREAIDRVLKQDELEIISAQEHLHRKLQRHPGIDELEQSSPVTN